MLIIGNVIASLAHGPHGVPAIPTAGATHEQHRRQHIAAIVDRYIAIWNETDAGVRRGLIARTLAEDVRYRDPLMQGEGHEGVDGMIAAVQRKFPGFVFRLSRAPETVEDRLRFSWEAGPDGAAALVGGTDFATVAGGRLRAVTGFIDFAPEGLG